MLRSRPRWSRGRSRSYATQCIRRIAAPSTGWPRRTPRRPRTRVCGGSGTAPMRMRFPCGATRPPNMTAEEIHQKGLEEVARIGAEMEQIFGKLGYNEGSVNQKLHKLMDDHVYPDGPDVRT